MSLVTGLFNESYDPIMDGVSIATKNYALWLNRTLGPSTVITPAVPGHHAHEPFEVLRYSSFPIPGHAPYRTGFPRLDRPFMKRLRNTPFDLVHAHAPFSAGRLALWIARQRGIPIVGTLHSKYRDNFEQALPVKAIVDWQVHQLVDFYNHLDEVWVPSQPNAEVLREYGFRKQIEVVGNGTDFEPSSATSLDDSGVRGLGEIEPEECVLLYVGQLVWEKNLKLLIEALGLLRARGGVFRMVFIGEGYARPEMERLIGRHGLADSVLFTGSLRSREIVGAWFARACALLVPSLYEMSPVVIREAASFAVPTVLMRDSYPATEITDGVNGFLSDNNADAFAARMSEILDRPQLLRTVGDGARHTLYRSWQDVVLEVKDRYLRLAARRAQS